MKLIDDAEEAVSNVEAAIAQFDSATAAAKSKSSEIIELEAAHQNNTADFSGDFKARLKTHSANSSALVLHRADLLTLQSAAEAQKREVLATGAGAIATLKTLHALLLAKARATATAAITELYAPRSVAAILHTRVPATKMVQSIPPVWDLSSNADFSIAALRKLRIRTFEPLRKQAEVLQLDEPETQPAAADVLPSAMAEAAV